MRRKETNKQRNSIGFNEVAGALETSVDVIAVLEAAVLVEEDVKTGLGKTVVADPVTSHISSILNVTNTVTTRRSAAAT